MPKSHFPIRGGMRPQAPYHAQAAQEPARPCERCRELTAELDRLQREMAQRQHGGQPGKIAGPGLVWAALGLCGAGLLFALMAILHHG